MRLINADALFTAFENAAWHDNADRDEVSEELLLAAPTIEPPQGEWTYRNNYNSTESIYDDCYVCSMCGRESETTHPFCPLCGAKMKGGE